MYVENISRAIQVYSVENPVAEFIAEFTIFAVSQSVCTTKANLSENYYFYNIIIN